MERHNLWHNDRYTVPTQRSIFRSIQKYNELHTRQVSQEILSLGNSVATGVAEFLFLCFTRHGCRKVNITDQGREFVNQVNDILKNFCCGDAIVLYFR